MLKFKIWPSATPIAADDLPRNYLKIKNKMDYIVVTDIAIEA